MVFCHADVFQDGMHMARAKHRKVGKTIRRKAEAVSARLRSEVQFAGTHLVKFFRNARKSLTPDLQIFRDPSRSPAWRNGVRLWARLTLLMSEGYNFDEFYSTQIGNGTAMSRAGSGKYDHLSNRSLLVMVHNLEDSERGALAMRELAARAMHLAIYRQAALGANDAMIRQNAQPAERVAGEVPVSSIHERWHREIETAFASVREPEPDLERHIAELSVKPEKKPALKEVSHKANSPVVVDYASFDRALPEILPYRASTRH
jgi:hypothetical protein